MTDGQGSKPDDSSVARSRWRVTLAPMLRAAGLVVALVTIYYVLPLDTSTGWVAITVLVVGLVALLILVGLQIRWILASPVPAVRAFEALAESVTLFLLLFAATYVVTSRLSSASFGQHLTHTDAVYFTVTVFTTVGFGDITAKTEAARILVTFQMIMDFVIIGLAIQAIVGAARHGMQRRSAGR